MTAYWTGQTTFHLAGCMCSKSCLGSYSSSSVMADFPNRPRGAGGFAADDCACRDPCITRTLAGGTPVGPGECIMSDATDRTEAPGVWAAGNVPSGPVLGQGLTRLCCGVGRPSSLPVIAAF